MSRKRLAVLHKKLLAMNINKHRVERAVQECSHRSQVPNKEVKIQLFNKRTAGTPGDNGNGFLRTGKPFFRHSFNEQCQSTERKFNANHFIIIHELFSSTETTAWKQRPRCGVIDTILASPSATWFHNTLDELVSRLALEIMLIRLPSSDTVYTLRR